MAMQLARITLFPIKSLDGIDVPEAKVLDSGSLAHDRRWALVDSEDRIVNGKRTAAVHPIRARYDLDQLTVTLSAEPEQSAVRFSLVDDQPAIDQWISDAVGIRCRLVENTTGGFPDDTDPLGPTVITSATLAEVANWFPGVTPDDARRRFRANLEIEGAEPFWEDRLVGPAGTEVAFRIGEVDWLGLNACQRCVVPTRDPDFGQAITMFQKIFARERERHLPPWAERSRFNHFYRLAVNTRLAHAQAGAALHMGDPVALIP